MASEERPPTGGAVDTAEKTDGVIGQLLRVNRPTGSGKGIGQRWREIKSKGESKTDFTITKASRDENGHTFADGCQLCAERTLKTHLVETHRHLSPLLAPFHCRNMEPPNSVCLATGRHPRAGKTFPPGAITSTTYVKHYNRLRFINTESPRLIRIDARVQRVETDGSVHEYALAGRWTFNDPAGEDPDPWNYGEPTDTLLGLYLNLDDEDNAANPKFLLAVPPTLVDTLDVTVFATGETTMTAFGYDGAVVAIGSWPDL